MASNKTPAKFAGIPNIDSLKKSSDNGFSGLALPTSQNAFEEVGLHKQLSKTLDDLKLRDFITSKNKEGLTESKVITDQTVTPKSQKQKPSDVKRWASVVKAQKKLQYPTEVDTSDMHPCEDTEITSEIYDCIFKTFPKSFENHKSFIVIRNKSFFCSVCSLNLDTVLSLSNHLKTRKHEDNAIRYFKEKLPAHLHNIMEFVSFYGSNLCCNLCRCKIVMSSHNPYETIVNIMAHNSDDFHVSKKVNHENGISADHVLKSLVTSYPIIKENVYFIDTKMVPEFNCKLCNKLILYDENVEILSQNFTSHMRSGNHLKNQKAVEVLKLFGETSMNGKDNWALVNGIIKCTYCNRQFESNLQQLISHVNDVEHATNVFFKLGISSNMSKVSESNTLLKENLMNEAKYLSLNKPKKGENDEKETLEQMSVRNSNPHSRLRELLNTMPAGLKQVDYVIENDKGSVTCLICNRVVPPSAYNLRTHLLGIKHKNNLELKKGVVSEEVKKEISDVSVEKSTFEEVSKEKHVGLNPLTKSECLKKRLPKDVRNVSYPFKMDKDSLICMVCKYKLPDLDTHKHLLSDKHKKTENLLLNNCLGCKSNDSFTSRMLTTMPVSIRLYNCRQTETIPASTLNNFYNLLLKENELIKKNEEVIVNNIDGKHSYCKLCKSLICLSSDLDVFENNIMQHLKEKRHKSFIMAKKTENTNDAFSKRAKVSCSLFDFPSDYKTSSKDSKVFNFQDFTSLISVEVNTKIQEDGNRSSAKKAIENFSKSKNNDGEIFVFGREDKSHETYMENSKNISTESKNPVDMSELSKTDVSCQVKFEEETDQEVLNRRQKQIDYGKNTEGYVRYCQLIPRRKRGMYHPVTPPKHLKCSRRTWDGMVRAWRRQLHSWDPPASNLDSDIRPLD